MTSRSFLLASVLAAFTAGGALAAPPTPDQIDAKTGAAMAYYRAQGEAFDIESPEFIAVLDEQLVDVDPAECNAEQVQGLMMLWMYSPSAKPAWMSRLVELGEGDEWFVAMMMLNQYGDPQAAEKIRRSHGIHEVPDERLGEMFMMLGSLSPAELKSMRADLEGLAERMPTEPGPIMGWMEYPALLGMAGSDPAIKEAARLQMLDTMKAALADAGDDRAKARLEGAISYLDGAAGRGELIGHPAPKVDLTWNNAGEDWHCFRCLGDKVVVVDFWATWCGPCVGSFPNVRDLVDHYEGYDVMVLGLTSPQPNVIFRDERGAVEVTDFEQECKLMADYAKAMDMTWPIAMSKQDVFNPDFGVRGIPHVAIIGCDGKVAYNGLHPAGDMGEKVEKINDLLAKAGKKHPGPWKPKAEEKPADKG